MGKAACDATSPQERHENATFGEVAIAEKDGSGSVQNGHAAAMGSTDDGLAAEATSADDGSRPPTPQGAACPDEHIETGIEGKHTFARDPVKGVLMPEGKRAEESAGDTQAWIPTRQELALVKGAASDLEDALVKSRSEAQELREMLAMEKNTTQRQAEKLTTLRYKPAGTECCFWEVACSGLLMCQHGGGWIILY